jgi:hypothetical protein
MRALLNGSLADAVVVCGNCLQENAATTLTTVQTAAMVGMACPHCSRVLAAIVRAAGSTWLDLQTPSRWRLPAEPLLSPLGAEDSQPTSKWV